MTTQVKLSKQDITKLINNQHTHTLMTWVEGMLKITKNIVSPQFFHPSFSKKQKDQIVGLIYTIYPNVKDIKPLGDNGVVIICDDYLDTDKANRNMDIFFKMAHNKAKGGSNYTKPKNRKKRK